MTPNHIRTISPSTNEVVFERPGATLSEAQAITARAQEASKSYKKTPLAMRKALMQKALDFIARKKELLAHELTLQMGRPIAQAAKEIETMCKRGEYLLSIADGSLGDAPGQAEEGFWRVVKKEPLGVVFISSAWNVSTNVSGCLHSHV